MVDEIVSHLLVVLVVLFTSFSSPGPISMVDFLGLMERCQDSRFVIRDTSCTVVVVHSSPSLFSLVFAAFGNWRKGLAAARLPPRSDQRGLGR
jgi:hypothetical protein